ncbi:MAG: hypothetical protein Aureis2KO_02380 [Aureisphaera sp.]
MRILFVLLFSVAATLVTAQNEFTTHENGLIYSPEAMSKLSEIVAMENQQFRVCDLSKDFKSNYQTTGYIFSLPKKQRKNLLKDIKGSISLEEFLKKYKVAPDRKELVVQSQYEDYEGNTVVEINTYPSEYSFYKENLRKGVAKESPWTVNKVYDGEFDVLYLDGPLTSSKIPYKYARMIQYSECLVDTTATIHPKDANRSYLFFSEEAKKLKQLQLIEKIDAEYAGVEPEPSYSDYEEYHAYQKEFRKYENRKLSHIKEVLVEEPTFDKLLKESYEEALKRKISSDTFERYVALLLSKKEALALKRNRIVIGSCSQDSSPRYHAMNIAQLSAESYSWEVFVRAHLDIMNDNFQRVSDGSYAWGQRNTYIKELEELDINVPDLLLGITLRTSNPSQNHYYGSIRRVGRAIAESEQLPLFKTEILEAIANEELDAYNRLMFFYTYANLQYNLDMMEEKGFNKAKVEEVRNLLPKYLRTIDY